MGTVLIVDDEALLRGALRRVVERAGYRVHEASDGNEAVRLCESQAIDVVLLDIFMPEKEGFETIRELRKNRPEVKIIAMSGGGRYGFIDVLEAAKKFGAHCAFQKPLPLPELVATLREMMPTPTA